MYFAFIVGNDAYRTLPRLTSCASAVSDMRATVQKLGYPVGNVVTLTNANHDTTMAQYQALLEQVSTAPNSTLLVYFSGHGLQLGDKDTGLVCVDPSGADREPMECVRISWLLSELSKSSPSTSAIIIVDACRFEVESATDLWAYGLQEHEERSERAAAPSPSGIHRPHSPTPHSPSIARCDR